MIPDNETQQKITVLKQNAIQKDTFKIYPFNPNFITDYKGYTLGLSITEIDRLHKFRKKDEFVNSIQAWVKNPNKEDAKIRKSNGR